MRVTLRICSLAAAAFLLPLAAHAQFGAGSAHGKVTDRDGKPVQGATVRWESAGLNMSAETKTNKNGVYTLSGLYAGKYKATVLIGGNAVMVQGEGIGNELLVVDSVDMSLNFNLKDISASSLPASADAPSGKDKSKPAVSKKAAEEMKTAFNAGTAALKANNMEEAVKQFQIAAEKDPSQPATFMNLGLALSSLKKYEDAITAYRQAIALKSGEADAHAQLSFALANTGKFDEAMTEIGQVAKVDRNLAAESYYNLGAVLTNNRKPQNAAAAFNKAVEMNPKNAEYYYQLGSAYFATPETTAQAVAAFEKYLELEPSGVYAGAAKQYIATGKARMTAGK